MSKPVTTIKYYQHFHHYHLSSQPRPQGLSSSRPRKREGETLVGAGHVSPREKLDPGRGPSPASLCQDLLSTPKRGFRFAARSPRETHSTQAMFFSSLHFASYYNINFKAKQVRCLEALYFGKDVVAVLPKGYGKIMIFHLLHSQCYISS